MWCWCKVGQAELGTPLCCSSFPGAVSACTALGAKGGREEGKQLSHPLRAARWAAEPEEGQPCCAHLWLPIGKMKHAAGCVGFGTAQPDPVFWGAPE